MVEMKIQKLYMVNGELHIIYDELNIKFPKREVARLKKVLGEKRKSTEIKSKESQK